MSYFLNNFNYLVPSFNDILAFGILILIISSFFLTGWLTTGYKILSPYNFGVGLYYFVFIFLSLNFFFYLNIILYFYLIIFFVLFFKNYQKLISRFDLKLLKKNKFLILIISIVFFLFLSAKPHGWDTFSFWLPRLNYILDNNTFPPSGFFRAEYPFSFELINFSVLHLLGYRVENIPSLVDCLLIVLIFLIFLEEIKKNIKNKEILLFVVIFFNPLIIHTNTFSAYQDLKLAFIIFLIVSYSYKKNFFLINNVNFRDVLILSFLNSILCVTKNIGIVYFAIISLYFFLINFYYLKLKLFKKKNLYKIIIYLVISLSLFFLWSINVNLNDINVSPDFKGLRFDILEKFSVNFFNQILLRKIYFWSLLIFISFFISTFIVKKLKHLRGFLAFILTIIILWKVFLTIFAISFQNYNHAINAHNFWRYFSHLSPIILYGIFLYILQFKYYLNKININLFFCFLIFFVLTIVFTDRIRRDLLYPNFQIMNVLNNLDYLSFDTNKKIYLNSNFDRSYQKEIIRYYLKVNTNKTYLPKDIITNKKEKNTNNYQINISKNKVTFELN